MTARVRIEDDDAGLVERIGWGDRMAFAEVYERHSDAVFGLALRLTRNRAIAEEVTQDVFVKLWKSPERFDPGRGSLRTFLVTMSHTRSIDVIRSESSRRTREEREQIRLATAAISVEEEVVDMHIAEHVRRALDSLTPDERAAIELAYFGGQSYREVALTLGQPEGTVKSRIRKGMQRLAPLLRHHRV